MGAVSILVLAILAQASTTGTNAQDRTRAQALLGEGATMYERGNYFGALEKFKSAYAAYPSSKIFFNIGQVQRLLGRPLEAREAYQRFLDEAPNASREDRADAQDWLGKLHGSLGLISVACQFDGAEISIDGIVVGKSPLIRPVWTLPGRHQVTAVKSGECPMLENVEVPAGTEAKVELRPLHGPLASYAAGVDVSSAPKPEAGRSGWWLGRKWTWVAGGSTVVLAGAAALVGLSMQSRFDDLKKSCGRGSPEQLGCSQSDIDSVHTRQVTANVLWGLAGAAAITTGVLFFVEGRPVAVAPMAGASNGVLARMEF
jgi:hypothetical protein